MEALTSVYLSTSHLLIGITDAPLFGMTYKQTVAINKAWFHTGASSFSPAGLIARLKSAIKLEIPVGYQDETGFHTGVKAQEKGIKWPTEW